MSHLAFVYGSLKQGFPNTRVNAGLRIPGAFRTRELLPMYLLGTGHVPCLVLAPGIGHHVHGEVYEVDEAALVAMDRLERLGEADGYARVQIQVEAVGSEPPSVLTVSVYARSLEQVAAESQRIGPLPEYTHAHAKLLVWQGAA